MSVSQLTDPLAALMSTLRAVMEHTHSFLCNEICDFQGVLRSDCLTALISRQIRHCCSNAAVSYSNCFYTRQVARSTCVVPRQAVKSCIST